MTNHVAGIPATLVLTRFERSAKYAALRINPVSTSLSTNLFPSLDRRQDGVRQAKECTAVKKVLLLASAVAVLVAALTLNSPARAQNGAGEAELPHKVGLIDMAHVFKNYKKFEALREDLKLEIEKSDSKAKEMAEKIKEMQAKMKDLKEGSPDYQAAEKQFLTATTQFEAFRKTQQRDFLRKESQIYKTIYMEVTEFVKKYAKYRHYTIVLRFNRDEPDSSDNPQEVMQRMNKQVVYYQENDDITQVIVDALNRNYAAAEPSASNTAPGKSATK